MSAIRMMGQVMSRPLDFFYDIQFDNRAKWSHAIVLVLLAFAVRMLSLLLTGYAYETREPYQISYIFEFVWIVVPWLSWCVANWGVSSILDGEGKFKDIFVSSAYTLVPYIVLMIPIALITNLLSLEEKTMYLLLMWFTYLWVALLVLIQVKVIHDFELGKMIWITFLTLIGMLVIWFIGLLVYGLVNQAINFVIEIIKEIKFRM
jgi:hypothetical protein